LKEVKSVLINLSKGPDALEEAYKSALERIKDQSRNHFERAKKVLWWITFAKRPLGMHEICCALAVEPGDTDLDRDNILDAEDLMSVCAGLVDIDPEGSVFRFIHYTTQEYFERIIDTWIPGGQLYVAQTCLTYLSFQKIRGYSTKAQRKIAWSQNKFLNYADRHWGYHVKPVEVEVAAQACKFLLEDASVACAQRNPKRLMCGGKTIEPLDASQNCFHMTAKYGFVYTTNELLRLLGKSDMEAIDRTNAIDHVRDTPLIIAIQNNHYEMIQFLLERGANANFRGTGLVSPLGDASWLGMEEVVKLLLEHDAEVNMDFLFWGNALYMASWRGHERVVRMLIEKGADVEGNPRWRSNALHVAVDSGHEQIVKLLLQAGANAEAISRGYPYSPLVSATLRSNVQVVRLLLEHGAYPTSEALLNAAATGNTQMVQLLLANGADVNAMGHDYSTALFETSVGGRPPWQQRLRPGTFPRVVKLLSEHGAGPMAICTKSNSTPLYVATSLGKTQVVELLLQKGADPNARCGKFGCPLKVALERRNKKLVILLIANGAVI
jgi:ankyrin repeat protein